MFEFLSYMFLLGIILPAFACFFIYLYSHFFLKVDSYYLARSHLYGNSQNTCEPSETLWFFDQLAEIEMDCDFRGQVNSKIKVKSTNKVITRTSINLNSGAEDENDFNFF